MNTALYMLLLQRTEFHQAKTFPHLVHWKKILNKRLRKNVSPLRNTNTKAALTIVREDVQKQLKTYRHSGGLLIFMSVCCKMGAVTAARLVSLNLYHNVSFSGNNFQETISINSIITLCLFSLFYSSPCSVTKAEQTKVSELTVARDYSSAKNTTLALLRVQNNTSKEEKLNKILLNFLNYIYTHIYACAFIHGEAVFMSV